MTTTPPLPRPTPPSPTLALAADLTILSAETPGFFPRKSMTRDGQDLNVFEPQPNIDITWPKCQFGFGFTSFLSITLSSLPLASTHPPTHSLSLRGHPTRSPLSDRIANARQLVTRSLVGRAFPRLMSFVLRHASATPPVTVPALSRSRRLPSTFCPKPSPRVYLSRVDTGRGEYPCYFLDACMWSPLFRTTPLRRTDNWTGSFWSHAPSLPPPSSLRPRPDL